MKGMTGIALLFLGVVFIIAGTAVLLKKSNNKVENLVTSTAGKQEIAIVEIGSPNQPKEVSELKKDQEKSDETIINSVHPKEVDLEPHKDLKKKGEDFEKFIVKKFNKEYFKLKEWAGDKYVDGIYAETSTHPDLVYELDLVNKSHNFAVECKWRNDFYKNEVDIATERQLNNYKSFENEKGIPVFVAVGVGGEPGSPKYLYVIPVKKIMNNKLNKTFLKEYEQEPARNFFFNYKLKSLTTKALNSSKEAV